MDEADGPYKGPAGGWPALASSLKHVKEQGIVGLGSLTMLKANQPDGFDCPGCAWPDANPHSTFEFCENGVKAVAAEATARRVTREFFEAHTVEALGAMDDYALEGQGRLTEPMVYDAPSDRYRPIAWDEAFALIARHLRGLSDPNQAAFYTSGRTSNEAAFLYQLFVREFGTNNLPDCSNMCHEPSGVALTEQIGIGKGTVLLEDFLHADAIFIFGQNPGTNHPRMLGELRAASKRGCRIVSFNPLRERGLERFAHPQSALEMTTGGSTRISSHYYQPRLGGDRAALLGIARCVLEAGDVDAAFIAAHTQGYEAFRAMVLAQTWADIERGSGLARREIEEAAAVYMASGATIFCWGMGITQHKHAVATIQTLIDVLLLKGNIGRPGAGACPVRGHSNVQGDRTMGIYEQPGEAFLARLGKAFDFEPPRAHGHDVVGSIEAMLKGEVKVFVGMGGNFAAATPDRDRTGEALRRCALTVNISTKLNRSHLVHGRASLILPCLGRTEIDVQAGAPQGMTVEDSMSMVHVSTGMNAPAAGSLRSEPAIVAGMAAATLPHSRTRWYWLVEDYRRIRDKIAEVIPGFEDFNQRLAVPGGFYLGNPARERRWENAAGRAVFYAHPLVPPPAAPAAAPLTLMTMRSHDQYNTTIYGLHDRYRGIKGERRVCFISAGDLQTLGLQHGQWVDIVSVWHDGERVAPGFKLVEYDIPAGCIGAYYPETNALVPLDSYADRARTPTSKSIPVRLRPSVRDAA
ncbi:FdhF/YdeP family oxidoreductase [Solimonas terrae]|uniref:FdhF/YdeP family oxidoreductase n=1 Tax=Solimonas terrae TaxID=1396819 RepID=A0A6M2BP34_9GAMM|nr:FdhF/YdeP family oxidoreductase [Solimonas terrae]NGY04124.1 FdhF/YdeP family oxidoreductase [Solimonas terrae]